MSQFKHKFMAISSAWRQSQILEPYERSVRSRQDERNRSPATH